MKEIGISVYPDLRPIEEIKEYIRLAASYGCTKLFSSMFNIEGTKEEVISYFRELIEFSHLQSVKVALDVNPECLKRLGATPDDLSVFHDLDVDILRMDLSFGIEDDLKLINNPYDILIEFNASICPVDQLKEFIRRGTNPDNILVCHNFYPQKYTGMKWDVFKRINCDLKSLGVQVGAFVSSNAENTHGVWSATSGLCTVEKHRGQPIDVQVRELLLTNNVDYILIGNAYAEEDEFKSIQESQKEIYPDEEKYPIIKIKKQFGAGTMDESMYYPQRVIKVNLRKNISEIEKEIVLDYFPHSDVGDGSEWIWRSRMPRFLYSKKQIKPVIESPEYFERGTVVIVNDNYKHYAGELQIVLLPIENDGSRNIVGFLDDLEMNLLESVPERETVIFVQK